MRRKTFTGNILLTALFIAVFLFFVSVALVSTNRMDLQLSLSTEHHLKARSAARSGAHYALGIMRTQADWESRLQDHRHQMDSGAEWELEILDYQQPGDARVFKFEIVSRGTSGSVVLFHRMVVEECQLSSATGPGQPHLFIKSGKNLRGLPPNFKWKTLGPLPLEDPNARIAGAGGPLFTQGPEIPEGLAIRDFVPWFVPGGEQPLKGPETLIYGLPEGTHLLELKLANETFDWTDIEDPGPVLGTELESTEQGEDLQLAKVPKTDWNHASFAVVPDGEQKFFELRIALWTDLSPGDGEPSSRQMGGEKRAVAAVEGDAEWASAPQKPPVEWYTAEGAFKAAGDTLYSHGTHYLFFHYRHQPNNDGIADPTVGNLLVKGPCILAYEAGGSGWRPVWNSLTGSGDSYQMVDGPYPNSRYLAIDTENNAVYSLSADGQSIVKLSSERFKVVAAIEGGDPRSLFVYQGTPYTLTADGIWTDDGKTRYAFGSPSGRTLSPFSELRATLPEVTGTQWLEGQGLVAATLERPREVIAGIVKAPKSICSVGKELYCLSDIREEIKNLNTYPVLSQAKRPGTTKIRAVTRYDGQHWEVWPAGLRTVVEQHISSNVGNSDLAMTRYQTQQPLLRRYAVIAVSTRRSEEL